MNLIGMNRRDVPEGYWRDWMEANYNHLDDAIRDVEWFAGSWSATELLENNDAEGIVEIVGDWVEAECDYNNEEEWSDLCQLFYDWWGCINLASFTPEWDAFWQQKLAEET